MEASKVCLYSYHVLRYHIYKETPDLHSIARRSGPCCCLHPEYVYFVLPTAAVAYHNLHRTLGRGEKGKGKGNEGCVERAKERYDTLSAPTSAFFLFILDSSVLILIIGGFIVANAVKEEEIQPPKDDDPDGLKLFSREKPIEQASKLLKPLETLKVRDVDVWLAIYDVAMRRRKHLTLLYPGITYSANLCHFAQKSTCKR